MHKVKNRIQYSRIEHLAKMVYLGRWKKTYMAMFTIYLDASGSPDSNTILSVAGFIAPVEQWIFFERDWKAALKQFGVSSLHMKHFAHSLGEYSKWKGDETTRRRFLSRLIAELKVRVHHSFVNSLYLPDYYDLDKTFCVSESLKPLGLAGGGCILKVRNWADKWKVPQNEILYAFEDGDKHKGNLIDVANRYFGISPVFMKKSESVAFEAADLLAYEHFRANQKVCKNPGVYGLEDLRFPLQALSKIPNGKDGEDWGIQDLPQMAENFKSGGFPLRQS
jgi:hypothetical protein